MSDAAVLRMDFESRPIRIVTGDDGEPRWVGADVCAALDITDDAQALSRLDPDERGTCTVRTPGGPQEVRVVTEPGLYRLVMRSRKPAARRFARWVAHDVLPAIRKTGSYAVSPTAGVAAADPPTLERDRLRALDRIAELAPHVAKRQRSRFILESMASLFGSAVAQEHSALPLPALLVPSQSVAARPATSALPELLPALPEPPGPAWKTASVLCARYSCARTVFAAARAKLNMDDPALVYTEYGPTRHDPRIQVPHRWFSPKAQEILAAAVAEVTRSRETIKAARAQRRAARTHDA